MQSYRIISADSHVQEPSFLYEERIPAHLRHRAPRVETRDGGTYQIIDGKKPRRLDVAASRVTDEDREREFRRDRFGGRNLDLRLADQDRDGVSAEVVYPNQSLEHAAPSGWKRYCARLTASGLVPGLLLAAVVPLLTAAEPLKVAGLPVT